MPIKGGRITARERLFAKHLGETGNVEFAGHKANYANPSINGHRVANRPGVADLVRKHQIARLNNDLLPLAINTLYNIMTADKATERGRLTAAGYVLKYTVGAQVEGADGKEPYEMSAHELQQRIDALRREAADRARPVLEANDSSALDSGVFD